MNALAVTLILLSTFMHAGWNLLARGKRPESDFFTGMLFVVVVGGSFPAIISEALTKSIPFQAWFYALGSGFCCGSYYTFLARAYASEDFTHVYPVARSLPVLLVGVGEIFLGRYPSTQGWGGMGLVVMGCLFVPLQAFKQMSVRSYWNSASLILLFAALGTVGYTLFDKLASEIVRQGPYTAARYGYFFFLFSFVFYSIGRTFFLNETKGLTSVHWKEKILAGFLDFGGYWLVLWAYQMAEHASYVVAFRQFSIVIGVVTAFIIFKEKGRLTRLSGTILITFGLMIIARWGS
jgi:drug/metabolite transporter (DMT)-like permease